MQKINSITVAVCFQILVFTGCAEEKYELCGTAETPELLIPVSESTAPATEAVTETAVSETTAVAETVDTATAPETSETVPEIPVTEAVTEEIMTETVAEMTEEIQETEELAEQETAEESTEDIVYINYSWDDDYYYFEDFTVTAEDYILLCNCVAHEAGSDWYSDWEKAKVVEVIFNRLWSPAFPDTIYEVITQPNQFTGSAGYANLDGYSHEVTSLCSAGVDLYLSNPDLFSEGYLFFYGDDYANYFY